MTKLRATMALAAEIAGIDRQRFNEAVAEGFYPCAPATVPGRARSFNILDLMALKLYGQLLSEGVTPRYAGNLACEFLGFLKCYPDTDRFVHVRSQMGSPVWMRAAEFDANATEMSGTAIISVREWRLERWRAYAVARLEDAALEVGPKDESDA